MPEAISIPGIISSIPSVIGGVNQVASGQGASGAPEKSAAAAGAAATTNGWSLAWPGAAHFMLRLAEGAVGLLLLAIGLNALLHNPAGKAAGTAARAAVRA